MNKILFLLAGTAMLILSSCNKDDDDKLVFDYHAHIHSPENTDYFMEATLNIDIEFESHTGQTVHHINVRIYNASTLTEVYNQPANAHVHATSGSYEFNQNLPLTAANGFSPGEWVLEAKVWGDEDGQEEVTSNVHFNILN